MSWHCWATDGYGFDMDDVLKLDIKAEKLQHVIDSFAPDVAKFMKEYEVKLELDENGNVDINQFEEDLEGPYDTFGICCNGALASVILMTLNNLAEKRYNDPYMFSAVDGFENMAILFEPRYPWSKKEGQKCPETKEEIETLYRSVIAMLTDEKTAQEKVLIDYMSIENGG